MADINLAAFAEDEFVFHFGGRASEIDAYTFANSLVAFAEAIREINKQINPGTNLEISIDGIGEGSFRVKLKTSARFLSELLRSADAKGIAKALVIGIFANLIYEKCIADHEKIVINDDSVIIQKGSDRIIVPRTVYERTKTLPDPAIVDKHISKGFQVLNEDQSVSDFGITRRLDDPTITAPIPREDFSILAQPSTAIVEADEDQRIIEQKEKLIVLRAILERSTRKWQFVWNGIRISAAIVDHHFFDGLARHEYVFGQGDILYVMLRIYQHRDENTGIFMNNAYEVVEVLSHEPGPRQQPLF
jgi:hypothetical protein